MDLTRSPKLARLAVFGAGALPEKTMQLIAVAAAHTTPMPILLRGHTKAGPAKGASQAEIIEVIWVAGGRAYTRSTLALDAMDTASPDTDG